MNGWLLAALLVGVLVWGGTKYADLEQKASGYAAVIAACANGGTFMIGETRIVSCKAKTVPAVN